MVNQTKRHALGRNVVLLVALITLFTLYGCTTGVKRDEGLTDFEAPNIPTNIVAVGKERAILLTWSANTEADLVGYKIYRSSNSGGPFTLISTVGKMAAPTYLDNDSQNGLVNDQYYYYKLSAFDTQGKESDLSRTNAIQGRAGLPYEERPPRVVNIKVRASTENVYLAWDRVTGMHLKGYNIYRGLSTSAGGVTWVAAVPQDTPGWTDTSVSKTSAEQYTYVIRSFNEMYTESENSDPVQVTLKSGDDTIPGRPTNIRVSNDTDPVISWDKPTENEDGSKIFEGQNPTLDLDAYMVFRANTNDRLFSLVGIVEDNGTANLSQSFKDVNGSPYNLYAVRVIDRNGNISKLSSISTQSSDSDVPEVPTGLRAWSSIQTESGIKLAWNAARNAISYNIYFSTIADGGYTKLTSNQPQWTETSAQVINSYPSNFMQLPEKQGQRLEFGVPYFFKISAVSASGKESDLTSYVKAYPGGPGVFILEGEHLDWKFVPANINTAAGVELLYNNLVYTNINYYSGAGVTHLYAETFGGPGAGDTYQYGFGDSGATFYDLPRPTAGGTAYRYNVYCYYYPHPQGSNWRLRIARDGGLFTTVLMEKDVNGYGSVAKGRTVQSMGQILIDSNTRGVDVGLYAVTPGTGGGHHLFVDALVFVRAL